jgi:hypothetical protein
MVIREPNLLAYLVDMFERTWERGRPFTNRGSADQRDIAHEQRQMTIRMLIEGHADPASAKRLGVSPRTYAGYIADLKEEFEAETRFQLGYTMGRLGMSGNESRGEPDAESPGTTVGKITRAVPVALPSFMRPAGGVAMRKTGQWGVGRLPVSSLCGVVGRASGQGTACRQPGQSHPVSCALAGALTPASPTVIAAAATRIAALRRKVIRCSSFVNGAGPVPPG